ncbi:MAG: Gfo/Idh/MocA family oxidoreductase [Bacteroidota bacterium]
MEQALKIGLLGVGHLGKIHLKCIRAIDQLDLVGFCDPDEEAAQKVVEEYGLKRFEHPLDLMKAVSIIDIVTPTPSHFELAKQALTLGCHLFIEKPVTEKPAEAAELLKLSQEKNLKVQVGHVERFNPALLALGDMPLDPMFIEAHRLALFNPRGTDVSVVLDLMIHDLDIVLSLVDSEVAFISASGVSVVSDQPDISNARLEFANGCVANLTASRISMKQMRKLRLFQKDAYISMDFLDKKSQIIRIYDDESLPDLPNLPLMPLDTPKGKKHIRIDMPESQPVNAIQMELEQLVQSIVEDRPPKVGIEAGYRALDLAHRILGEIDKRQQMYSA